jgi:hypothetical protein
VAQPVTSAAARAINAPVLAVSMNILALLPVQFVKDEKAVWYG